MDIQMLNERIEMLIRDKETYDCECIKQVKFGKKLPNINILFRQMASKLILIYEDMREHMVAAATEADTIIQELRAAQNNQ